MILPDGLDTVVAEGKPRASGDDPGALYNGNLLVK